MKKVEVIIIKVEIIGPLKKPGGEGEFELELKKGVTVEGLLEELSYEEDHRGHIAVVVNDELKRMGDVLSDGDHVVLAVPVGGG